jgi:glycosyltransferase involved in cell wall biosynthesis
VKSGVDNKVAGKCNELKRMFPGSAFVRFSTQKSDPDDFFESVPVKPAHQKYFKSSRQAKNLFAAVDQLINSHKGSYDFYLVRYPFASKPLLNLLKAHPGKIIFEHNTNERAEKEVIVNANKKKIPFSLSPSVLVYYAESIWNANVKERNLGTQCLKLAAGGVAVTPEIERIEKAVYPAYKTVVITNGIVPDKAPAENKTKDLSVLNGVFLAGTNAEWNGIERIIRSFTASGTEGMHLYFVGRIEESLKKKYISSSVHFLEYMSKEELKTFLGKMHFAIGTCAIHKKGLTEGAVLKVRECLAAGLPIVLGHIDPYIDQIPELKNYCIAFPPDDSLMDFNLVSVRLKEMYKEEGINDRIKELANTFFSWEMVLEPLKGFLNALKN